MLMTCHSKLRAMNKAVFIDKDGTLIPDVPYNVDPQKIKLYEGAGSRLKELKALGYLLIVVSNQSGIAKGYFTKEALNIVEHKLQLELQADGIQLDGFYYCPHHPDGKINEFSVSCDCRKPKPGMLITAANDFQIDLTQSWMVGDILNDVEAGNKAGCKTILVNNGNETEWVVNIDRLPTAVAPTLHEALNYILNYTDVAA
jgi:D-glycero-D-manno-heptose 1,7-bisphosphate phosphatase